MVCMQIVCYRDLHGHDYLPQELVCEMNCLYRTELVCEMNCLYRTELVCEMNGLYRTELVCEMNGLYRTELVCCDGVAEVEPQQPGGEPQQPGVEPQRLARVLQHIPVAAGKVCNQGCRKICLFRRDFPRDQYVAQGHECYNRYIRQESILSILSTKISLYFS